jgi:UTP--glucose-1-phosphate uridylyltransferase
VHSFIERFQTIPDILELDHLTVSGDVTFGKGVTLKVSEVINEQHTTLTLDGNRNFDINI